jgi:hypothetical protein
VVELIRARQRGIPVIPVRFEGAPSLATQDLPTELNWLRDQQAHEMSEKRWEADLAELSETLIHTLDIRRRGYRSSQLAPISVRRRQALIGFWTGSGRQEAQAQRRAFNTRVSVRLKVVDETINGLGHFSFARDGKQYLSRFKLEGSFSHDRFLKLDYRNVDDDAIQFGCFIAQSANGKTLSGYYVGYGAVSENLVRGFISLSKHTKKA